MENITHILNTQKFLLSGFISDWYINEYENILTPEMFWRYKKEFEFLQKNWNAKTPDFLKHVNWKVYIEIMEHYNPVEFITKRNKYIKELITFYYKEKVAKDELSVSEYAKIQITFEQIDILEKNQVFNPISYETSLERWYEEWLNTNPEKVMSWGWKEFDQNVWYLMWWQVILLGWTTGTWKSTFANQIACNVSKQWFKVAMYRLEDRLEEKKKEELYYMIWRIRKEQWLKNYPWAEFEINNIKSSTLDEEVNEAVKRLTEQNKHIIDLDKKKRIKIEDLEKLVESQAKSGCRLFIIDHLHYFDMWDKEQRHDLIIQDVMQRINDIARNYNITIILIAHYKKLWKFKPTNEDFKDWNSIWQVANKIIHIYRDFDDFEWLTEFIISKLRWPIWTSIIKWKFDAKTFEYTFEKSEMQITRERIKK